MYFSIYTSNSVWTRGTGLISEPVFQSVLAGDRVEWHFLCVGCFSNPWLVRFFETGLIQFGVLK